MAVEDRDNRNSRSSRTVEEEEECSFLALEKEY